MRAALKKIIKFFIKKKEIKWKNIEYFDSAWKDRIKEMATFIDSKSAIMDLGCGEMWLKEFITENELYFPVDYTSRGEDTIVCDFNKQEFPEIKTDIAFISGCLEYIDIDNVEWFVEKISQSNKKCILSYCTTEKFPNIISRKELAWKNHLSKQDIITLFNKNHFSLVKTSITKTNNEILIFEK